MSAPIINVHSHVQPRRALDIVRDYGVDMWTDGEGFVHLKVGDWELKMGGGGTNTSHFWSDNLSKLRDDLEAQGVDIDVLWPSPMIYLYFLPPEVTAKFSRAFNEAMAEAVAEYPDNFWSAAHLPMQDVDRAIVEAEYAVTKLGCKTVAIGVHLGNGRLLSDPYYDPFYEAIQDLDVPVMVHPNALGIDLKLNSNPEAAWALRHGIDWIWGYPFEETAAVVGLIRDGTLDRFPGLRFVVSHGGGDIALHIGRLEAQNARSLLMPGMGEPAPLPIREYLRRNFWFDTTIHDPKAMKFVIDQFGVDNVILGSNYPGWDHFDAWNVIRELPGLTEEDRVKILGRTAAEKVFKVSVS